LEGKEHSWEMVALAEEVFRPNTEYQLVSFICILHGGMKERWPIEGNVPFWRIYW
jgi:hypothetical protein